MNATVTVVFPDRSSVQGFAVPEGQAGQVAVVDVPVGVAVSVIVVPLAKAWVAQGPGFVQLKPFGLLATVPVPDWMVKVKAGFPPPPAPVKHTTFAVI